MSSNKQIILVIGATGAQGLAVIDALLAPAADGTASPYTVRGLTRDPESRRARALAAKGVELVKGSVDDLPTVLEALKGAYGAWVNIDSFTVGEQKEVFLGIRLYELAKQAKTIRHFIWSSLDYVGKKMGYNPKYRAEHYDGKGRVADFLKAQPSVVSDNELSWSCVSTGPYMDSLYSFAWGPIGRAADGTFVFATPIGDGHVPLVSLADVGFFARYSFDHRAEVSGRDLEIASEMATLDDIVAAFKNVTGEKAVAARLTVEEWFENIDNADQPLATENTYGDGSTTWKENFTAFYYLYRDDIIQRDMAWIRQVNPKGHTLESWMRERNYKGELKADVLKKTEDKEWRIMPNPERIAALIDRA